MESDESRPVSSASTSSDSSENSRASSPIRQGNPKSPPPIDEQSRSRASSRSISRSSNPRSVSKSGSHSRSSSSSSDNDEEDNAKLLRTKRSSRSSSEESNNKLRQGVVSRNQSISPVRKSRSKRNSSASSNQSLRSNDIEFNEDGVLKENALNMSHEDLSDVSDMETEKRDVPKKSIDDETNLSEPADKVNEDDDDLSVDGKNEDAHITDLRQKLDKKKNLLKAIENKEKSDTVNGKGTNNVSDEIDDLTKNHDEDALDFEAEDGECIELSKEDEPTKNEEKIEKVEKLEEGEELEEGEVSDEEEKRPEENEPKPICRFYTRGQCTWGMSCRFLHPGVTDKGNYTMFDMVRPVPVPHGVRPLPVGFERPDPYIDYRNERPALLHRQPIHHHLAAAAAFRGVDHEPRSIPAAAVVDSPVVESAWERGLRTAKEMMRKANKRKEQDMDFDDKKMNLKISPDELEKDSSYYIKERITPPDVPGPPFARHPVYHGAVEPGAYSPPERYMRGPVPFDDIDPYGRSARYRELPSHRMPQYEDERRVRPAREVIVQRVEPAGRGDEWSDPWMRSKSPGARAERKKSRRDRSYSSNSSYSTSSSSQSDSSSESSRSPSPSHRRRYNSGTHKSPPVRRHAHPHPGLRSPSPRRVGGRRSPSIRRSPIPKRRHMSPSPIDDKRTPYSPVPIKRKKISTPPSKPPMEPTKGRRRRSSSSDSGSSDSSGSESDSSGSSSSGSSSRGNTPVKRGGHRPPPPKPVHRNPFKSKVEPPKKRSPISMEIKKPNVVGVSALTSPTPSNDSPPTSGSGGKKVTRREELLKQLRAVEDAIARKRTRLT